MSPSMTCLRRRYSFEHSFPSSCVLPAWQGPETRVSCLPLWFYPIRHDTCSISNGKPIGTWPVQWALPIGKARVSTSMKQRILSNVPTTEIGSVAICSKQLPASVGGGLARPVTLPAAPIEIRTLNREPRRQQPWLYWKIWVLQTFPVATTLFRVWTNGRWAWAKSPGHNGTCTKYSISKRVIVAIAAIANNCFSEDKGETRADEAGHWTNDELIFCLR